MYYLFIYFLVDRGTRMKWMHFFMREGCESGGQGQNGIYWMLVSSQFTLYLGVGPSPGIIPNMTRVFMNLFSSQMGKGCQRPPFAFLPHEGTIKRQIWWGSWEFPICGQVGQKLYGNLLEIGIWSEGQSHGTESLAG